MDCEQMSCPTIMWQPNKSKETKMDKLRKIINTKYNANLDKFDKKLKYSMGKNKRRCTIGGDSMPPEFETKDKWRPTDAKRIIFWKYEHPYIKDIKVPHLLNQTYKEFHRWSCDHYAEFWEEVWKFTDVIYSQPYDEVVDKNKTICDNPEWFHGARLNFAENLLRYKDERIALYYTGEGRDVSQMTFQQLRCSVARYAAALKKMGVKKGDRVVGYIPNCVEAVVAMLAAASIGGVWSSTSPDFGVQGVLDRFSQIRPKVIFSVNAVWYNGKVHPHLGKLQQVVKGLPDLEKVVVIPFVPDAERDVSNIPNSCLLEDFLAPEEDKVPDLEFEQVPFNHPLFIMYSSGTTGMPKCMVHSVGGTLLKHLEEHVIQSDMTRDDVMLYYTTVGWMMWNWLVSVLSVGAAAVLYDGSPLVPHANILWDLVDKLGITMLGTSAKWLAVMEDKGLKPISTHKLTSLKMILSTGSPLKPQSYDYVYSQIKSDLLLASISGGTDIIACFMGQNWTVPVYRGEVQGFVLGCDMECWDESAKPVYNQSGELVCLAPFPSMPVFFWNDPDGLKYKKAYFQSLPGVWAHGDFCSINKATGGIVMQGRSDGVLNPNGVRFGSAEVYNIVESFKEIEDSVCVAQRKEDLSEERVILFLKMAKDSVFNKDLVSSVRERIRKELSARHVPSIILSTNGIPYTLSGKKTEVAVRKAIHGEDVPQKGALSNPECLDLYYNIPELQGF